MFDTFFISNAPDLKLFGRIDEPVRHGQFNLFRLSFARSANLLVLPLCESLIVRIIPYERQVIEIVLASAVERQFVMRLPSSRDSASLLHNSYLRAVQSRFP
jgi:hypothetical protein